MSKDRVIAGRYRIKQRLGRGNFGVVWEADEMLGGSPIGAVAIKVFTADVDRREIALLAGLSHPTILAYRAVVEDDDEVCLVTELADGGDAAGRLRSWPDGLPVDEVRGIVRAVASALVHLHEQGWVHRDVKPANILFVKGTPKLGDVGTARALTSTAKATSMASLAYAAPELFAGKTAPSIDIYALGCTTYELLTGRLPFDGNMSEIVNKHLTAEIVFPADMSMDLVDLIRGSTAKDPDRRWTLARVLESVSHRVAAKEFEAAPASRPAAPAPALAPAPAAAPSQPTPPPAAPARPAEAAPRPAPTPVKSAPAPAPAPAPVKSAPAPAPAPAPAKPSPLDPALRRHLRLHGDRWGDADVWRTFMQTAGAAAAEQGLSERDLIRRGSQLLPEIRSANLSELEKIAQIGTWVVGLRGRRWTAPAWADLLDRINTADDAAMARHRDALIVRLYPPSAGATRLLDLGGGVHHVLVYTPLAQLYRPTVSVVEALRLASGGVSDLAGVWHSAQPVTIREWSTVTGQAAPAGLQPDHAAVAPRSLAELFLTNVGRRFPTDELRWPYVSEYDGMKTMRQQATEKAAAQAAAAAAAQQAKLQAANARRADPFGRFGVAPPARPAVPAPRKAPPKSLAAAVAESFGKAAGDMLREMNETWLTEPPMAQNPKAGSGLTMNLVSPVPKVT
jgi:hypothetical protein